jgi:hypothetical protein
MLIPLKDSCQMKTNQLKKGDIYPLYLKAL